MTVGPCQYVVCPSVIGTNFRAAFNYCGGVRLFEVLLCYEHARLCEQLRKEKPPQLSRTEEGWVYAQRWMDAWGFLT